MKTLATHAIKAVYGKIDPFKLENSFEVRYYFAPSLYFYLVIWIRFYD